MPADPPPVFGILEYTQMKPEYTCGNILGLETTKPFISDKVHEFIKPMPSAYKSFMSDQTLLESLEQFAGVFISG